MKYVRRLLWFIASRMMLVCIILLVMVMAFYMAMNAANIYILLSDGMNLRTSVILTREDPEALNNYFRADFLQNDQALNVGLSNQSPYIYYDITDFEDNLTMEWVWSWPWEDTAQATIVYRVPEIKGSVISSRKDLVTDGTLSESPPVWQGGRYRMTFYRVNGQWKIAGMTQTQVLLEPTPLPTQTPAPTSSMAPANP